MRGRFSAVLVLGPLIGCSQQPVTTDLSALRAQIEDAEAVEKSQAKATREIAGEISDGRQEIARIAVDLRLAEEEFVAAQKLYEHASSRAAIAASAFESARDDYQRASQKYRQIAGILILAAASDLLVSQLCNSTMSTRTFREQLRREGVVLENGVDVDHIWPRALGGVDHPANYQLLPAEVNRRLGASVAEKFFTSPISTLQGLVTSALVTLRCG